MKAITEFHPKPVPSRSHDWSAVSPNYEPGDPIGYGPTEGEAIDDLIDQLLAHCTACDGSGEGQVDGARCTSCKGKGQIDLSAKAAA